MTPLPVLDVITDELANAFPPRYTPVPEPRDGREATRTITGFFTDTTLCIGCKACEVACKQWNQLPADGLNFLAASYDNTGHLSATTWRHVAFNEKIDEGRARWLMLSDVCKHCDEAPCQQSCPTGSIIYNELGNVYVQPDICNGCGYCIAACPFGVLGRSPEDGHAHKCTLCYDRQKGGMTPACAKACPTASIQFGPLDELRDRARRRVDELHERGHRDAFLYGADSVGDYGPLHSFFLLEDHPNEYNLPENPPQPLRGVYRRYGWMVLTGLALSAAAAVVFRQERAMFAETRALQPTGHATAMRRPSTALEPSAPNYHDIPLLKKPVWTWEIGVYFFLGGLSAGSYLLARLADRFGGRAFRPVARTATAVSFASMLPCPLLLISDLGDPKRFHHMLRVFKPHSPMSAGSWALLGFSGVASLTALAEWLRDEQGRYPGGRLGEAALLVLDAAGMPIALFFSGYTGVLLSGTATPVWTKNPWLGPLFSASAIANAAAATTLALYAADEHVEEALDRIETAAGIAEIATTAGYVAHAGPLAAPLLNGPQAPFFWAGAAGLVASEVLRHVPAPPAIRRWTRLAGALAGVASGFCLKWAMQRAGANSASDPEADRRSSRRPTASIVRSSH